MKIEINDDAREYFASKNLSYEDISRQSLRVLESILNQHFAKQETENRKNNEVVYWRSVNQAKNYKGHYRPDGSMIDAYLTGKGGYFNAREVISFNEGGWIGFCGEASGINKKPVLDAFVEWCDWLSTQKENA